MWMEYLDEPIVPDFGDGLIHESSPDSLDENDNYLRFPEVPDAPDETPFLLLPEMAMFLRKLINLVDIRSFVRLSRTSREMHTACMRIRGHRVDQVKAEGNHLDVRATEEGETHFKFWCSSESKRRVYFERDDSLPRLESVHFKCDVTRRSLSATHNQVDEFYCIDDLTVTKGVTCWPELLQFMQDYGVRRFYANTSSHMPSEDHHRFMRRTTVRLFEYIGPMPGEHIVRCWIPHLSLLGARITPADFTRTIQHIVAGFRVKNWTIGTRMSEKEFTDSFSVYKSLPFNFNGGPPSSAPPIVFLAHASLRVIFLGDGRLVEFHYNDICITIKFISNHKAHPEDKCPPCLQRVYYHN